MKTNNKQFDNKELGNKFADEVWEGIDDLQPHTLELVKSATALGFTAALNRVEDDIKKAFIAGLESAVNRNDKTDQELYEQWVKISPRRITIEP